MANSLKESAVNNYFETSLLTYDGPRKRLLEGLKDLGIPVYNPSGTYFMIADFSKFIPLAEACLKNLYPSENTDYLICRWLTVTYKVTAIPCSAFYSQESQLVPSSLIRFCFAKSAEMIDEALLRLQPLKSL